MAKRVTKKKERIFITNSPGRVITHISVKEQIGVTANISVKGSIEANLTAKITTNSDKYKSSPAKDKTILSVSKH